MRGVSFVLTENYVQLITVVLETDGEETMLIEKMYVRCPADKESMTDPRVFVCGQITKVDSFKKTVLAGAGFTLFIEVTQLFCLGRHTDVDDLFLNTLGATIGAWIVFMVRGLKKAKDNGNKI